MMSGEYQESECFNGESLTWQYLPGGFFLRPPDIFSGGPEAVATSEAIWFLREQSAGEEVTSAACLDTSPEEDPAEDEWLR
jgi:hypothetical protein